MRFLVAFLLVLAFSAAVVTPARGDVTQLKAHMFARGVDKSVVPWLPVEVRDDFSPDDMGVFAFTTAVFSQTDFTYRWYAPDGSLFGAFTQTLGQDGACTAPKSEGGCLFYGTLDVAGTDAASKLGTWRMELLAGGKTLYTDQFTISAAVAPAVHEEFSWTMNIRPDYTVAVQLDETLHPFGKKWPSRVFDADSSLGFTDFAAHDSKGRTLTVDVKTAGSRVAFTVLFPENETYDYTYTLTYIVKSAVTTDSNGQSTFSWGWCTGYSPLPQNVTVHLPQGYALVEVQNVPASSVQASMMDASQVVRFSGVAPSRDCFNWKLVYAPGMPGVTGSVTTVVSSALTSSASTPSASTAESYPSLLSYLLVAGIVGVLIGVVAVLLGRKRRDQPGKDSTGVEVS